LIIGKLLAAYDIGMHLHFIKCSTTSWEATRPILC